MLQQLLRTSKANRSTHGIWSIEVDIKTFFSFASPIIKLSCFNNDKIYCARAIGTTQAFLISSCCWNIQACQRLQHRPKTLRTISDTSQVLTRCTSAECINIRRSIFILGMKLWHPALLKRVIIGYYPPSSRVTWDKSKAESRRRLELAGLNQKQISLQWARIHRYSCCTVTDEIRL